MVSSSEKRFFLILSCSVIILIVATILFPRYLLILKQSNFHNLKHTNHEDAFFDEKSRVFKSPIVNRVMEDYYPDQKYDLRYQFSLSIPEGWEITTSEFNKRFFEYGEYSQNEGYFLILEKEGYMLDFRDTYGVPDICIFKDNKEYDPGDELNRVLIEFETYETLSSEIGTFRLAKRDMSESGYVYHACTFNSLISGWELYSTKIGKIRIDTPKNIDPDLYLEIIEMLRNISYTSIEPI